MELMASLSTPSDGRAHTLAPGLLLPPLAGVVLDVDGTLVDNAAAQVVAWRGALLSIDRNLPSWVIREWLGIGRTAARMAIEEATGAPLEAAELNVLLREHDAIQQAIAHTVRPIPGAPELLDALHYKAIPTIVVTGAQPSDVAHQLPQLDQYGIPIISTTEGLAPKPSPESLLLAADRIDVTPSQIYSIGDTRWDVQAAREAGMISVGVLSGAGTLEELHDAGAALILRSIADFLDNERRGVEPAQPS